MSSAPDISPVRIGSSLFVFARGTRAAEPHIRSPRSRRSPKSLMLEVSGSETGPIFMTASCSQNVIRSVHRYPPGQLPHRGWYLLLGWAVRHAGFKYRSLRYFAVGQVAPQRDQQLARERDDRDSPPRPRSLPTRRGTSGSTRFRVDADPEPGQLDHGRAQPPIAGLRDPLLPGNGPAAPWRRDKARVGGDLSPVRELRNNPST